MKLFFRIFTLFLLLLLSYPNAHAAVSGPVMFNVDVPPGQWKGVRIKNLPRDAVVAVQIESDGNIVVGFVDAKSYKKPPESQRPLFIAQMSKIESGGSAPTLYKLIRIKKLAGEHDYLRENLSWEWILEGKGKGLIG